MNNRKIIEQALEQLADYNGEESDHEAFLFLATTIREGSEPPDTHDTLIANCGKVQDLSFLFGQFIKSNPKAAFPAIQFALMKAAEERGLAFIKPLLDAVFLPLQHDSIAPPIIISPFGKTSDREN